MAVGGDRLLVVGGGIGGLSTALAVARTGRPVRVLEQAPAFAEIGAGLQLAPNATRILDRLGVLGKVIRAGVLPESLVFRNAVSGRTLTRVRFDDAYRERYGGPYVLVHRSDLLDILVEAAGEAGVELVNGARVERVEEGPDGATVVCADGTRHTGAAVAGCDGMHSRLRARISGDELVQSGFVAYRGTIPIEAVDGGASLRDVIIWLGPGLHLVQYPLRSGRMYNQVAVFRSPGYAAGEENWGAPHELEAAFARTCEQVRTALPRLGRERWWPMADRDPIPAWTKGRVTLLGDAAHPMLQYLAQGACQAIEDAAVLADTLDDRLGTDGAADAADWSAALEEYTARRADRTAEVQRTARIWGDIWHVEDRISVLLRDEIFASRAEDDLRRADWLWGDGSAA
jgi:3-hydroxybenzoate 6-monooxygenase